MYDVIIVSHPSSQAFGAAVSKANSSKNSMYITGDNGEPMAKLSSCWYTPDSFIDHSITLGDAESMGGVCLEHYRLAVYSWYSVMPHLLQGLDS